MSTYTHDDMLRLEGAMRSASIGLRAAGVTKQMSDDLRTLEYVMSVLRMASDGDMSNPEEKAAALEMIFCGLFYRS